MGDFILAILSLSSLAIKMLFLYDVGAYTITILLYAGFCVYVWYRTLQADPESTVTEL